MIYGPLYGHSLVCYSVSTEYTLSALISGILPPCAQSTILNYYNVLIICEQVILYIQYQPLRWFLIIQLLAF